MNSISLMALAATLSCFVLARFALTRLLPLIPIGRVRQLLPEPASSSLLAAMLSVVAGLAAVDIAATDASPSSAFVERQSKDTAAAGDPDAIARLAAFVRKTERNTSPPMTPIPAGHPAEAQRAGSLPDVDTMIARLAARLETDSGDADGWRTLGWSYFATENYPSAIKAYDRALDLRPDDSELKAAAAEARAKLAASSAAPDTSVSRAGPAQN